MSCSRVPAGRDPSRPKVSPPPGACDTHAHVFGPASRFPYADDRSYTPPRRAARKIPRDARHRRLFARRARCRAALMAATMARCSMRWPANRSACAASQWPTPMCRRRSSARWHALGVRGLRCNHFFRGGALHYRGGVPLDAAKVLAPTMAELGWHVQLWIDVKDLADTFAAHQGDRPARS